MFGWLRGTQSLPRELACTDGNRTQKNQDSTKQCENWWAKPVQTRVGRLILIIENVGASNIAANCTSHENLLRHLVKQAIKPTNLDTSRIPQSVHLTKNLPVGLRRDYDLFPVLLPDVRTPLCRPC